MRRMFSEKQIRGIIESEKTMYLHTFTYTYYSDLAHTSNEGTLEVRWINFREDGGLDLDFWDNTFSKLLVSLQYAIDKYPTIMLDVRGQGQFGSYHNVAGCGRVSEDDTTKPFIAYPSVSTFNQSVSMTFDKLASDDYFVMTKPISHTKI